MANETGILQLDLPTLQTAIRPGMFLLDAAPLPALTGHDRSPAVMDFFQPSTLNDFRYGDRAYPTRHLS